MNRRHLIALCAVGTLVVVGVLLLRSAGSSSTSRAQTPISTNPPVTLRWINTGNFDGHFGTTFWATNHTRNEVMLTLYLLETNSGTHWVTACRFLEPLYLVSRGSVGGGNLKPYGSGYATVQLPDVESGVTWRVRAGVARKVTGMEAIVSRLRKYPRIAELRIAGNTNMPVNPLSTNIAAYEPLADAMSQEVLNE